MLDFGIDPDGFIHTEKLIKAIAKRFSLSQRDLDNADSCAVQEINTAIMPS